MVKVIVSCNVRLGSVWDTLAKALGREPTKVEAAAAVRHILRGGRLTDYIETVKV